jgi:Protein of unknown function (DUF938)
MVHISPWDATLGLIKGAAAILPPASPFYPYGPYKREGLATAPSNQAFDRSFRDRNPMGSASLEVVAAMAQSVGFSVPAQSAFESSNTSREHRQSDEADRRSSQTDSLRAENFALASRHKRPFFDG